MNRALQEVGSIVSGHEMGPEVLRWMEVLRRKRIETYRHCARVAVLAGLLGKSLGLSSSESERLVLGCFLHDMGKILIPKEILDASLPLTEREWRVIKLHPCIGVELTASLPFSNQDIEAIVRSHHERWDGRGYPDGLKGMEIPLFARICSVADAYDSMRADRPYQPRKTQGAAWRELQLHAGKQFDEAVVVCFGGLLQQVGRLYPAEGK